MSKKPFVPPIPHVDPPSQETIAALESMTKREQRKFKKSAVYKKHVLPVIKQDKAGRKKARAKWWKNNWIALLGLILALIATVPVIVQGVAAILRLLE